MNINRMKLGEKNCISVAKIKSAASKMRQPMNVYI